MDASEVEAIIRAAFAKTPKPKDSKLTDTYDDEGAQEYFQGRSWDGHSVEDIRLQADAMCFFTPEAFRYYLPAFMLAELSDSKAADIVGEYVVYKFGPQSRGFQSLQKERLAVMSHEEKLAVLQFIRYMQEKHGGFEVDLDYFERVVSDNKN
jgi:hypothetical protein